MVLIYLTTLGWNIYLFVLLGRAVESIGGAFFSDLPSWIVGAAAITAVLLVTAIIRTGTPAVRKVSQLIAVSVLILSFVIMGLLLYSVGLDTLLSAPAIAPNESVHVNWSSAMEVLIASNLSWWAYTGAIVRNSPSARQSLWPVVLGLGLAVGVGSLTGFYGGLVIPESGGDPTQYLVEIGGPVVGIISLAFIILANIGTAVIGVYASTIATRQLPLMSKMKWVPSTLVATVPALILAGFFPDIAFANFSVFLSFLGIAFAPMCGIQIMDYFLLRRQTLNVAAIYDRRPTSAYYYWRGFNPVGFIAFFSGVLVYLYLLDPITYESRTPFEFMTATIPTVIVAGLIYWLGTKLLLVPQGKGEYKTVKKINSNPVKQ
ncbi:hypothetical protein A6F49_06935 [Enteractinococcus helveticum]|uniref:Thiamine permease n=1 Tax=Enteractinococcus helveticum TaxID=1837282 RepID=A0A1B7M1F9_9MICC|nr:hypothetical protein A6F49_06935 [Enteractinococcus helveticum]